MFSKAKNAWCLKSKLVFLVVLWCILAAPVFLPTGEAEGLLSELER